MPAASDVEATHAELAEYGFDEDAAREITSCVCSDDVVVVATAGAAVHIVRFFRELGALDDDEVREECARHGLLGTDEWHAAQDQVRVRAPRTRSGRLSF